MSSVAATRAATLPRFEHHGFVFTFALPLIRADQIDFRANQKERE